MRERKRTKINSKLLKAAKLKHSLPSKNGVENGLMGLEHYKVYSTSKTSNMDRRGQRGLHEKDIKLPKNHHQAMRSKHVELWRNAMDTEKVSLKDKEVLRAILRSDIPSG